MKKGDPADVVLDLIKYGLLFSILAILSYGIYRLLIGL
jgi:hypothetical protein